MTAIEQEPMSPGRFAASRSRDLDLVASNETAAILGVRRAAGLEVISLFGSPFWLPPEHVLDAARAAVSDNRGAPASGLPALRAAMAKRIREEKGIVADPETEMAVTNAANHGLYVAFTTVLDPGDEVLTFSPHYYYQGTVTLAGGVPTYAETQQANGWAWEIDALRAAVTARTKVIVVNTPTNPTGYVATRDDLQAIVDIATERDLLIVSDEAYDHTVYDGAEHISIASLPGARERTLTVLSCTKSYAMRHWRLGFLIGPAELMAACRNVLEWNVFSVDHIPQHAMLAALSAPLDWLDEIASRFARTRDLMAAGLRDAPGITFAKPRGGPFLFILVAGLRTDAEGFRYTLLNEHGVPTDPGRAFGSADHLRLMFGGDPDDVREAARRITEAASTLVRA
jgi:aspartate/methionine/tyrosine aminotransferase